ncbi:hypothetical protein [Alkanindiges illinoisensis]|uniref:hypothetical protein n=1 Tax=Alkanindiges illinoisensis TaxID=197183 RepID=UPI00047A755F|nr:hypothetical protein [Alkanindiges illinoisensis]
MIGASPVEIQAYAVAMLHEMEISEQQRLKQKIIPTWINVKRLYARIEQGLQCSRDEVAKLLLPYWNQGCIERRPTNRYIRLIRHPH